MDRLTELHYYPDNIKLARLRFSGIECDCEDYCKIQESCVNCEIQKAYNRLAAYEDTGLTPEEITAMKADNEKLHKLVDATQKILWSDTEGSD